MDVICVKIKEYFYCKIEVYKLYREVVEMLKPSLKGRVVNKAFSSLSFRGKRGYPTSLKNISNYNKECIIMERSNECNNRGTYGAILCIKNKSGDEEYALVQGRYTGKWSFPKGHLNEGEEPFECTLREVAEETGIDTLPDPIEYVKIGYGNYFVFYLNEKMKLVPRDTNEIMNTKWVTLEEMERMILNADASLYRKKLKDIDNNI